MCHVHGIKNSPTCQAKYEIQVENCVVVEVVEQQRGRNQCTACITGCLRRSRRYTVGRLQLLHHEPWASLLAGDPWPCSCPLLNIMCRKLVRSQIHASFRSRMQCLLTFPHVQRCATHTPFGATNGLRAWNSHVEVVQVHELFSSLFGLFVRCR